MATDYPCSYCHKTDFPKCRYNMCVTQEMIDNNIGYNGTTDIVGLQRSISISSKKSNGEKVLDPEPNTSYYSHWLAEKSSKRRRG